MFLPLLSTIDIYIYRNCAYIFGFATSAKNMEGTHRNLAGVGEWVLDEIKTWLTLQSKQRASLFPQNSAFILKCSVYHEHIRRFHEKIICASG